MQIRDRVKELRRVKAERLKPHPRNWRKHPPQQSDALRGVLAEIGYAGALLARELPDGSLQLVDGHLRAQTTPEVEVPVLIVDLDDDEADKLLAILDPLAAMAEADQDVLTRLLQNMETENEAVAALMDDVLLQGSSLEEIESVKDRSQHEPPPEVDIPETFQIVVDCRDEVEQKTVYERLTAEGLRCRVMNL